MCIPDSDKRHIEFADQHTTPVVTYVMKNGRSTPAGRGTGVFLEWHRRYYVLTNTHVLEAFSCLKEKGREPVVQVKGREGEKGIEEHNGYLLMPRKDVTLGGVASKYDHRDVGLVELKPQLIKHLDKKFLSVDSVCSVPLSPGDVVFFKGFPAKSAEFLAPKIE
jgi:hypothetical protein